MFYVSRAQENSAGRRGNMAPIAGLRILVAIFKKKLLRINPRATGMDIPAM
jgi:hypothetical protein